MRPRAALTWARFRSTASPRPLGRIPSSRILVLGRRLRRASTSARMPASVSSADQWSRPKLLAPSSTPAALGAPPKVGVVLIGANNFGRLHWSAEDTLAGIRADVEALRKRLPRTKILLLGILPSGRGKAVERKRAQVNAALGQVYAHDSAVRFVDLSAVFLRDGRVAESLYLDPELKPPRPALHPSAEGQARMAAAIEPVLAALLGDRNHLLSH